MSSPENTDSASMAGKVALITGAAQGVGFGIAQEFLAHGATVVITDLKQAAVDDAVSGLGQGAFGITADVTDLDSMEAAFETVMAQHGRLDAVVANAGVGASNPLGKITEEQFDFVYGVNVKGVLFTVQPALPLLQATGGTAVIIGSTASIQPPAGMSLYGGAKAAVRAMVRTWIQDVRGTGVRINVLSPGAVDTPSLRNALAGASGPDQVDALVEKMGEGNPLGRLADPREMGRTAVFLSSDASSFITGVELFADGGMAQTG